MTINNKVVGDAIGFVGGPVGAVYNHGQAYVGEALKPAAMTNRAELRRLADRVISIQANEEEPISVAWDEFEAAANPGAVLSLLDELDAKDNTLLALTTRHFAESWSRRSTDAKLDEYLSAGIAQLQEERDAALAELEALREKAEKFAIIERVMEVLKCDEREGGIWTACSLLLISSAHKMDSAVSVVDQKGVTASGESLGDWRVTVERVSKEAPNA